MKIPREAQQIARKLYQLCLNDEGWVVPENISSVVEFVLNTRPRYALAILQRLYDLCRPNLMQATAKITTAQHLQELESVLAAKIKGVFTNVKYFEYQVDPSLIAGIRIQIGFDVWDGSIKHKLQLLQQEFSI